MVAVGPDRRAGIRRSSSGSLTCARKMPATGKELRISRRHATGDDPHGGKVFWDAALVRLNGCWPGRKPQIDGSFGGTDWQGGVEDDWGKVAWALPVYDLIDAAWVSDDVWDHQNLGAYMVANRGGPVSLPLPGQKA